MTTNDIPAREDLPEGCMMSRKMQEQLTVPALASAVSEVMGVSWNELVGGERRSHFSTPRKVLGYLLRRHTRLSLQDIGDILGGRHHTTVLYWVQGTDRDLKVSPRLRDAVSKIKRLAADKMPQVDVGDDGSTQG